MMIRTSIEPLRRTVGFGIDCWYFPELDQWKFGRNADWRTNPIFSIGPLRFRFKSIHISR